MKAKAIISGMALGMMLSSVPAKGGTTAGFDKPELNAPTATVYANTLPPIGYVDFCGRDEAECKFTGGKADKLVLTEQVWSQIRQVNKYVNATIHPVTDIENFGVINYWTYPVNSGLCHSYALLKKRYLSDLGISPDKLLMTVVLTENGEGHAVLTIPTDQGDLILDNRRQEILRWDQTGYTYLKRQSQPEARQWVSLQRGQDSPAIAVVTTGKQN